MNVIDSYSKIGNIKLTTILFINDKTDTLTYFEHILEMYENVHKENKNVAEPIWMENVPIFILIENIVTKTHNIRFHSHNQFGNVDTGS